MSNRELLRKRKYESGAFKRWKRQMRSRLMANDLPQKMSRSPEIDSEMVESSDNAVENLNILQDLISNDGSQNIPKVSDNKIF